MLKINNVEIAVYPSEFTVTTMDLDNADSSVRTADGTLNRDRVAVKRQIDMTFGVLSWAQISALLQSMSAVHFSVYYPDPMDGVFATRDFYVGNRPAPFTVFEGTDIKWSGLKLTLTET